MRPVIFEPVLNSDGKATAVNESLSMSGSPSVSKSVGNALQIQYENFIRIPAGRLRQTQHGFCIQETVLGKTKAIAYFHPASPAPSSLRDGNLMCTGVAGTPQPIISNVKDFASACCCESRRGSRCRATFSICDACRSESHASAMANGERRGGLSGTGKSRNQSSECECKLSTM